MDSSRFKEILLPLSSTLYRSAYRIVNDEDIAKDMVQDTYMLLWDKRDMLEKLDNVEFYVIRVLRNKCIDYLRTIRKYETLDEMTDVEDEDLVAEEVCNDNRYLNGIVKKMDLLPERQKQILILRCVNGLSLGEITELTGLTNINVRTLLSRARKRLRGICELELKEKRYEK